MLDNKFGEKVKTNIKTLSLEGAEKRELKWFDVERDITKEDITNIKKELARIRNAEIINWRDFVTHASLMRLLGIKSEISSKDKDNIVEELDRYRNSEDSADLWSFFIQAKGMHLIGIKPVISSDDKKMLKERLANYRFVEQWFMFSELGACMRIFGLEPRVDEERARERLDRFRNMNEWFNFAAYASNIREMGIESKITTADEKKMKEKLAELRNRMDWTVFVALASNMRILAADEIKVGGPKGLEIIDHKPKDELATQAPIPDQRNF